MALEQQGNGVCVCLPCFMFSNVTQCASLLDRVMPAEKLSAVFKHMKHPNAHVGHKPCILVPASGSWGEVIISNRYFSTQKNYVPFMPTCA